MGGQKGPISETEALHLPYTSQQLQQRRSFCFPFKFKMFLSEDMQNKRTDLEKPIRSGP